MKNLKFLSAFLICLLGIGFTGCEKDDEAFEGPISFYIDGLKYTSYDYKNCYVSNPNQTIFDELVIPSTVTYNGKTYNVSEIGSGAFSFDEFTSLTISNGIKTINNDAFMYCEKITTITIPNSVREIGISPFSGNKLANIVVEPGNRVYDSRDNCNAIIETRTNTLVQGCKKTIIPNTVINIGERAFSGLDNLTKITIPKSVTSIGDEAFIYSNLTNVTIPNSVTNIGRDVFNSCDSLTNIIVEQGNSVYDSRDNCNAIIETRTNTLVQGCKNTIIPNTIINIGRDAFTGHDNLTKITIPNSVTSIGDEAFRNTGLISLTIPNSVTKIEEGVFAGCDALRSIYLLSIKPITAEYNLTNDRIYKSCTLYVPQGSLAAYKSAEGWKEFENIVEFDPSTL